MYKKEENQSDQLYGYRKSFSSALWLYKIFQISFVIVKIFQISLWYSQKLKFLRIAFWL